MKQAQKKREDDEDDDESKLPGQYRPLRIRGVSPQDDRRPSHSDWDDD